MKSEKKKINYVEVTDNIDNETGEIVSSKVFKSMTVDAEPAFVKLYVEDIVKFNGLPPSASKVFNLMLRHMSYNNIIPCFMPMKKLWATELKISMVTINESIWKLYTSGFLIRYDRGLYIANPNIVGRGKWEDIKKLRMIIEYDEKNGRVIVGMDKLDQLKLEI